MLAKRPIERKHVLILTVERVVHGHSYTQHNSERYHI